MAKFTLVSATTTRDPHRGLMTIAYYKQDPSNPLEKPQSTVIFNRWPTVTIEAEVIEYPLNGVYENKNHKRLDSLVLFCPKTTEGLFCAGRSPAEQIGKLLTKLTKVEV